MLATDKSRYFAQMITHNFPLSSLRRKSSAFSVVCNEQSRPRFRAMAIFCSCLPPRNHLTLTFFPQSILGDYYNKDFRRRMETRQTRRDHVGNVDLKLTCGGGFGSTCSPFQALHIPVRIPEQICQRFFNP